MPKTLRQQIDEKQADCKTLDDWKEAFGWLEGEAKNAYDTLNCIKVAIREKYGDGAREVFEITGQLMSEQQNIDYVAQVQDEEDKLCRYGYTKGDAMLLTKEEAEFFFSNGGEVLMLFANNTSQKVTSPDDFKNFVGYFGITDAEADRLSEILLKEGE